MRLKTVLLSFWLFYCLQPFSSSADHLNSLDMHVWTEISHNTISDVDPCPVSRCDWSATEGLSGVVNDWTGGAYAENLGAFGSLIYWGGGHGGYYGNEVYVFDLNTGLWSRKNQPTEPQTPGDTNTYGANLANGTWWDNRPIAVHTYDGVSYHPTTNRFLLLTSSDSPAPPYVPTSFTQPYTHRFSFSTNDWSIGNRVDEDGKGYFLATAHDPVTDLFWIFPYLGSYSMSTYDPNSDSWTTYSEENVVTALDHVGAIDPTRRLFVVCSFRDSSNDIFVKDITQPNVDAIKVTSSGQTAIESNGSIGFEWVEELDSFVAYSSGQTIYFLKPPDTDWQNQNWVWTSVQGSGVDPGDPVNGPYSKFQYASKAGVVLLANSVTGPVFAMKIAEPGVSNPTTNPNPPTNLRMKTLP